MCVTSLAGYKHSLAHADELGSTPGDDVLCFLVPFFFLFFLFSLCFLILFPFDLLSLFSLLTLLIMHLDQYIF